jgi:hypothetical protein
MLDYFLHSYNSGDSLSAFNAAHKYRIAKRTRLDTNCILRVWQIDKKKVLVKLINCLKEKFSEDAKFAIALAPSKTFIFIEDIRDSLKNTFTNAIDFSQCFSKSDSFEAIITNKILSDKELRERIFINQTCFNEKVSSDIGQILLVDDVYSLGNTFRGMILAISDIDNSKEIITAAILKTT